MWGAVLGVAGSLIGARANKNEIKNQRRSERKYQAAFNQYADYGENENDDLTKSLRGISHDRYEQYANVGGQLNGAGRGAAGDAGEADYAAQLNAAMARVNPEVSGVQRGGPSPRARDWRARSNARFQPKLAAQRAQVAQGGRMQGVTDYQENLYDQLGEGDVDRNRKTAEANRRAGLLEAFRNRKLQEVGNAVAYKGPGNGYYNAQLAGQLLQLGGTGVSAYQGNQAANRDAAQNKIY